jgi:murein DD-endopeptidase MepM/ murein hydrolase activator NlpD
VRSYNGGPYEGHHTGTDIAVPLGRPVLAPARARVALIDKVQLRGNIVVLDHGLGVFTTYGHLSEVDVQVGQEIAAGQPFAKVGTTGLSEGPHLHWELWVGGVNVDPVEWTKRSVP